MTFGRNIQSLHVFGIQFERQKVDKKSKPTRKLKHANFILQYFEYFCQMSSKLRVFLRHSVDAWTTPQYLDDHITSVSEVSSWLHLLSANWHQLVLNSNSICAISRRLVVDLL